MYSPITLCICIENISMAVSIFSHIIYQKPKQKYYLLASIEPDRDITGGPFYNNNQFDAEFVSGLMEFITK